MEFVQLPRVAFGFIPFPLKRSIEVPATPAEVLAGHLKVFKSGGELMASNRRDSRPNRPPATTPESRENQLIALAVDLAERQMQEGKASSQVITHYLKLGSTREKLEQERLKHENNLLEAKRDSLASAGKVEELYRNAVNAFRSYVGNSDPDEYDEQILCRIRTNQQLRRSIRLSSCFFFDRNRNLRFRTMA